LRGLFHWAPPAHVIKASKKRQGTKDERFLLEESDMIQVHLYHKAPMVGVAVMMLMASTSVVAEKGDFYYHHNGLYEYRSVAPSPHWDRHNFRHSGTRGRLGLGADPAHPEGPGNPSE
jgi:hypothetical protein